MTSNDDANGLDWQRYEAEVVDLGAERVRRDWADLDDQAAAHPVDSPEALARRGMGVRHADRPTGEPEHRLPRVEAAPEGRRAAGRPAP